MNEFLQQVVDGIESGAIYAALALALVLVHRSTGLVNFAQGEIAMFSAYVTFMFLQMGLSIQLAALLGMATSFAGGMLIERTLFRSEAARQPLVAVVLMLGLFLGLNSAAGLIWSPQVQRMPSLFPEGLVRFGGTVFSYQMLGTLAILLAIGRALMASPQLLLLDEPSLGLSPLLTSEIFGVLNRLRQERALTMLIVEQNAALSLGIADSAYVLEAGSIMTSGSAEAIVNDDEIRRIYLGM